MADIYLSAMTGLSPTAQLYLNEIATGSPVAMTEIPSTGEYYGSVPGGTAAGKYLVILTNGSTKLGSGVLIWDGTKEIVHADLAGVATAAQVTALGSPLQTSSYVAPANTDIAAIKAKTDILVNGPSLSQIEGSTVLAKEASVVSRASQVSVTAIPTNPLLTNDSRLGLLATASQVSTLSAANQAEHDATQAAIGALPTAAAVAAAVRTNIATELGRMDVAVSSRLASTGYTAPANADIAAIKAKTDVLQNTDTSTLATSTQATKITKLVGALL